MTCPSPVCDGEAHRVTRTHRGIRQDRRTCICSKCNLVFETVAVASSVHIGSGRTLKMEEVRDMDSKEFKSRLQT